MSSAYYRQTCRRAKVHQHAKFTETHEEKCEVQQVQGTRCQRTTASHDFLGPFSFSKKLIDADVLEDFPTVSGAEIDWLADKNKHKRHASILTALNTVRGGDSRVQV